MRLRDLRDRLAVQRADARTTATMLRQMRTGDTTVSRVVAGKAVAARAKYTPEQVIAAWQAGHPVSHADELATILAMERDAEAGR